MTINVDGDLGLEEGSEHGLGVDGENTTLTNKSTDGATNGDGVQGIGANVADGDKVTTVSAVNPSNNGSLEARAEGAVTTGNPGKQRRLDIGRQTANDTATSANAETGLDISTKANGGLDPGVEGNLSRSTQDEVGHELGSGKDTVNGDIDGLLGGQFSAGGDVHSQSGNDIGRKDVDLTLAPGEERGLERAVDADIAGQPGLELQTSSGVNDTVTAPESTTLEGSSTAGAQAGKKVDRARTRAQDSARGTTEDGLENTNNLRSSSSQKFRDESQCPAFGNVCRISESGACQTGKHNE